MIGFGEAKPSPALSSQSRQIVVTGFKPTGALQIGNYFGAIKNAVRLQEEYSCIYFIADYHAITEEWEPDVLRRATLEMVMDLIASGLDPERCILFVQSDVPEHTELSWIFNNLTSFGALRRMTQFKDKSEGKEFVSAGLFDYPVLMAADILIYRAHKVPVGDDQLQHLELTREIARRFNSRFGNLFPEPQPILSEAPRIMSLADPSQKMGKSLEAKHSIFLMEPEDSIHQKIKTAVTDIGPRGPQKSPGVANLFLLLKLTAPPNIYDAFEAEYAKGTLKYERLKEAVYEHLMRELQPIRERRKHLKESEVRDVLHAGAEKAAAIARETVKEVKRRIGVGQL